MISQAIVYGRRAVIPLVGGGILGDFSAMTLPQLLILGSTFLSLAMIVASFYAIFAGQLRERMQHGSMRRLLNRCGGSALIGAGIFTAAMQRSS